MLKKTRIDVYMVQKGLVPSRTKAQDLIVAGLVSLKRQGVVQQISAPSFALNEDELPEVIIQKSSLDKYVSRAGLKMEGALRHLNLDVTGARVLDVGISTGGFTDCLLQRGAHSCLGVDVGHNQLSMKLKSDPRVRCLEGINAREMTKNAELLREAPAGGFDLVVVDVSFISLTLVLPSVCHFVAPGRGQVLALVKPQFEVGPEGLDKNGIVREPRLFKQVEQKIHDSVLSLGGRDYSFFDSEIEGKDGNKEFFVNFKI